MRTPPPEMSCAFLIQLVFCKKKTLWFIGVEVEQEASAPPPKKKSWIRPCTFNGLYGLTYMCTDVSTKDHDSVPAFILLRI